MAGIGYKFYLGGIAMNQLRNELNIPTPHSGGVFTLVVNIKNRGLQKGRQKISVNLLKTGMNVEQVAQVTGLTVEKVRQLQG